MNTVSVKEVGRIKEIRRSIVKIEGLPNCMLGQLVNFSDRTKGFVMGFTEDEVLVLLLGNPTEIKAGEEVSSEEEAFRIPVGKDFIGRVVNPLCQPLDGKGHIRADGFEYIFRDAAAILDRVPIEDMFSTGIRIIDALLPIGKGQRQLIIGDRMTGKTAITIDSIINQKGKDAVCIYCCIGRDYASFEKVLTRFSETGAFDYTIVVAALASSSIGEQYLAPYAAATLGEYFMYSGKDVLVVFDDLTKHAWAYRELSLLLGRAPGREAYPGDIFYLHAQLMERGAKLAPRLGGGSMTLLPIVSTLQGDITGFIPTNAISMTDGQVFLNSVLFAEGFKPAIDIGLSVSRIGNKVQSPLMRELTKDLGLAYIQYKELLKATRLRAAVSEDVKARLKHGERIELILMQENNRPSPLAEQLIFFYALRAGALDNLPVEECEIFKNGIYAFLVEDYPDMAKKLEIGREFGDNDKRRCDECITKFFKERKR
ncbi:MAG: F0F1 ATP synthase subunit alpha [Candidatus Omnitrophota bacterium]